MENRHQVHPVQRHLQTEHPLLLEQGVGQGRPYSLRPFPGKCRNEKGVRIFHSVAVDEGIAALGVEQIDLVEDHQQRAIAGHDFGQD